MFRFNYPLTFASLYQKQMNTVDNILEYIKQHGNAEDVKGMGRFGINTDKAFGVKIPVLRQLAKNIGKNQSLALELWEAGFHEARLLAIFIADHKQIDEALMEKWVLNFDSWDICDQCCGMLFDRTPLAFQKAIEWAEREEEFVKRAGFVIMAALAVHQKKADDKQFLPFFSYIEREAGDERNFVKKAVNWALRQIGKRSVFLNEKAIEAAERIMTQNSKSAKWIVTDALKELKSEKQHKRMVKTS
jgi:3-methyladenine DNA glycosylase AlkD